METSFHCCHLGLPPFSHHLVSSLSCAHRDVCLKQLLQQNLTSDCSRGRGHMLQCALMGLEFNFSKKTLRYHLSMFSQDLNVCLAFPIYLITDDQCCKAWDRLSVKTSSNTINLWIIQTNWGTGSIGATKQIPFNCIKFKYQRQTSLHSRFEVLRNFSCTDPLFTT